MVVAFMETNTASAAAKRTCFGLDTSRRPAIQHESVADQQWLRVAEPETDISAQGVRSSSNSHHCCYAPKQSPQILLCQKLLDSISDHIRRSLCRSFTSSFNEHVPLLSEDQIKDISCPQEELEVGSMLLHIVVLATGLQCFDKIEPEVMNLRISPDRRSVLHSALKEAVEFGVFCKESIDQLPILLMLSELERSIGYFGSADLYLKEAIRIGALPSDHLDISVTDEEVLRRRCYVRACDFIRLRWNLHEYQGSALRSSYVENKSRIPQRPKQAFNHKDLRKSSYLAHHDLLHLVSDPLQISQAPDGSFVEATNEKLCNWYASLPHGLNWNSPRDAWPASLFYLHLQYLASQLLVCAGMADLKKTQSHQACCSTLQMHSCTRCHDHAIKLADTLAEYGHSHSMSKAPLIIAHHAELASGILLSNSTFASDDLDTLVEMPQLKAIQSALERIASSHSAASTLAEGLRSRLRQFDSMHGNSGEPTKDDEAEGLEEDSTIPGWQALSTSSFDDMDTADLFPIAALCDLADPQGSAEMRGAAEKDPTTTAHGQTPEGHPNASNSAPSQHLRNNSEERLILISDPVFCAYVDEISYIVGQYNSPPVEGEHSDLSNDGRAGSRITSSPKDAIRQLRMQLGHDPPHSSSEHTQPYLIRSSLGHSLKETAHSRTVAPILATN